MSGTKCKILSLYRQMLRASKSFTNYNYRNYALRRTKEEFRKHLNETNPKTLTALVSKAEHDLQVIKRQATIGQLYTSNKLVIEMTGKLPDAPSARSD